MQRVVIVNKSDSTGGAAVVSYRLMEALRQHGVDARMIVVERRQDSPYVSQAASGIKLRAAFLAERLKIYLANGFDKSTLFKIDTLSDGVDIMKHPWVQQADAVMLNWVNQGMLSFRGLRRLLKSQKRVIWTMHDMWCFTGICHHSGDCRRYESCCRDCKFLNGRGSDDDLSTKVFKKKKAIYPESGITFVAVSSWLAEKAARSALMSGCDVKVIPNPFPLQERNRMSEARRDGKKRILFGAARLDDPIKGLPILVEATKALRRLSPERADNLIMTAFGDIRDRSLLDEMAVDVEYLGRINGAQALQDLYEKSDVVVSTSHYETLPGTLVEGQAYGSVPVAFLRGGQADIVAHKQTGYLAEWDDDPVRAGENIAKGILWAIDQDSDIIAKMYQNVADKFSYGVIAEKYKALL